MKPAPFDYVAAESLDQAVALLSQVDGAQVLAGGQSLVPLMCQRLSRPRLLVDITGIAGLDRVVASAELLQVGAACRQRMVERHPDVRAAVPVIAEAASLVGHVQVRNRGTIGGSVAHADPAAELPAALLAAGASVRMVGPGGERTVAFGDFVLGPGHTALRPGELVVGFDVPIGGAPVAGAFSELAPRLGDLPIVGVGCTVGLAGDGACAAVRLTGCGIGPRPVDLSNAALPARGERQPTHRLLAEVARGVAAAVEPTDDERASAGQRREAAQMLALEALVRAWRMADSRRGRG